MKSYTRYLVVKVTIQVDASYAVGEIADEHIADITDGVAGGLDCTVSFDQKIKATHDYFDTTEIPVKITETEVLALLDTDPT